MTFCMGMPTTDGHPLVVKTECLLERAVSPFGRISIHVGGKQMFIVWCSELYCQLFNRENNSNVCVMQLS